MDVRKFKHMASNWEHDIHSKSTIKRTEGGGTKFRGVGETELKWRRSHGPIVCEKHSIPFIVVGKGSTLL